MSKYGDIQTQFTDGGLLIEALEEMGYKPINCIDKPQQLEGYQGDKRKETAHVIIPRKQVGGAANDIGFTKGPDGKFRAIISEYDSNRHNAEWLGRLRDNYTEKGVVKVAKQNGFRAVSRKAANGKRELEFIRI